MAEVAAKFKSGDDISGEVNAISNLTAQTLTKKPASLNMLRSALYRLNEAAFNGFISGKEYYDAYMKIVESIEKVQIQEINNSEDSNEVLPEQPVSKEKGEPEVSKKKTDSEDSQEKKEVSEEESVDN